MEIRGDFLVGSDSTPTTQQFTFKNRICVFCALPLDLKDDQFDSNLNQSLNEDTFVEGVSILCEVLNVKENLHGLFGGGGGGSDNWRLLGIDNFVQWICCEKCYSLISELVSLRQLILKSQISLKENARKLENFVVSSQTHHNSDSEAPSLEYSVHACVQLRQEILNNYTKNDKASSSPENLLPTKSRSLCHKKAVVLLERLKISPHIIKQSTPPLPSNANCNEEPICPSPPLSEAFEPNEDENEEEDNDQEYLPIKRRRRSAPKVLKRGRPKRTNHSNRSRKTRGKPGRPRKIKPVPPSDPDKVVKRKQSKKSSYYLIEEDKYQLKQDDNQPKTITSAKGGRPLVIGSRHYRFLHEGSGAKLHAIYFLSTSLSPSPFGTQMETYLMIYNVKFQKTSTFLRCLHPNCDHQESLTGYFTDQTILRNMRFHIRFAHRSPPKKDKLEEDKPHFYYCHSCESQMESKVDLIEHRKQVHPEADPLPSFCYCDVCGDPSVPSEDFIQHLFSHKSELEMEAVLNVSRKKDKDILKPIFHPCDQCDKFFKCHTELMTHRIIHLPSEIRLKFFCEFCGKGFKSVGALNLHRKRVHLKELAFVFECHVCGKGFTQCQKTKYKEHLNAHTGEKPFQCEQCGKGFIGKWHLIKHVRLLHEGEKDKVSCEFCGKIYKDKSYLRKHLLKKHRDKIKINRVLGEEEDKDKYKPLEQRHDFIGPKLMFPCEPCGKVFIFKSMLITHLKNRHKMFYERNEDYPWQLTLEDNS